MRRTRVASAPSLDTTLDRSSTRTSGSRTRAMARIATAGSGGRSHRCATSRMIVRACSLAMTIGAASGMPGQRRGPCRSSRYRRQIAGSPVHSLTAPAASLPGGLLWPAPALLLPLGLGALALELGHQRPELRDRSYRLLVPGGAEIEQMGRAFELHERLTEIATLPGGEREMVVAVALVALAAEEHAAETLRFVERRLERGRALILTERALLIPSRREGLPGVQVRLGVIRVLDEVPLEHRLRLLVAQDDVHATERAIDPLGRVTEVARPLERAPGRVVLADRLVHPAEKELAVGILRLLVGLVAVARDHLVGRLDDRPRDRLHLRQEGSGRRAARGGHELLCGDRRLDVRDTILGDGVREHVGRHAGGVEPLLAEQ